MFMFLFLMISRKFTISFTFKIKEENCAIGEEEEEEKVVLGGERCKGEEGKGEEEMGDEEEGLWWEERVGKDLGEEGCR